VNAGEADLCECACRAADQGTQADGEWIGIAGDLLLRGKPVDADVLRDRIRRALEE